MKSQKLSACLFEMSAGLLLLSLVPACSGKPDPTVSSSSGGATSSGGTVGSGGATASSRSSSSSTKGSGQPGTGGKASGGASSGVGGNKSGIGGVTEHGSSTTAGGTNGSVATTGAGGSSRTGDGGSPSAGAAGTTCSVPVVSPSGADFVANGPLITFNDDGGWCWYQDERAVVDAKGGKLVVGSMAFLDARKGNIETVIYDLATRKVGSVVKLGNLDPDDHNAPAFIVRPDGKYAAMWAGHNQNCNSYFSVYDGSAWAAQQTYDWTPQGCPWSRTITYSNLWYLGTDLVSFVRSIDTSPSYLISKDHGASWTYGGRLTSTATVGYVAGYYKYWGNNTDRIDFVGTEAHPRDNDNSLYSGYVKDGKIYKSTGGDPVDSILADQDAEDITAYTPVFKTRSKVGEWTISNAWNSDLVRYDDGTLGLIWTGRVGSTDDKASETDLRLLYGRFDGTSWKLTYLAKAGPKLYGDEQDYTGLGALHPDDPTTIYISTPYDPNTDTMKSGAKREIWRGTTCDNGATFQWTPVTANSTKDNYRPIVPKWDASHTALLWMRGEYRTAQDMTMNIVGTISGP